MFKNLVSRLSVSLVCLALLSNGFRAEAQEPAPSGGQAAGIFAILIGAAAGAGVGVYFLVRAPHNITGCVSEDGSALQLTDEQGKNLYLLAGDIAMIKPSEKVRLSGKPGKDEQKRKTFSVKKVSKIYGPCTAPVAVASR